MFNPTVLNYSRLYYVDGLLTSAHKYLNTALTRLKKTYTYILVDLVVLRYPTLPKNDQKSL